MHFQLITPEATLFSGEASQVTVPGVAGEFGVLPGHEPLVSLLKSGVVVVESQSDVQKFIVVGGVAEVKAEAVSVLAEEAKALAGITSEEAKAALNNTNAEIAKAVTAEEQATLEHKAHVQQLIVDALAA